MSSSNRRAIVVLAGLALVLWVFAQGVLVGLPSSPDEQRYQAYRYAPDKPLEVDPDASSKPTPEALQSRTPCSDPKGKDESDLCAQWKAANAAADSASWAKWGFWIGVAGSSLLLWQIMLTRKAVKDTSKATEAMERQNDLAQDAQRPWLSVTPPLKATLSKIKTGGQEFWGIVRVEIQTKNFGNSPAIGPQPDVILVDSRESFDRVETQKILFDAMKERGFGVTPLYPGEARDLGEKMAFFGFNNGYPPVRPDELSMMIGLVYRQPGRDKVFHTTTVYRISMTSMYPNEALLADEIEVRLENLAMMTEAT